MVGCPFDMRKIYSKKFLTLWVRPPHLSKGYYRLGRTFALSSSHHYNITSSIECQTLFLNLLIKFCTKLGKKIDYFLCKILLDKLVGGVV